MPVVLCTWEMGLNLGHISRLASLVSCLKRNDYIVTVAVRDLQASASILGVLGVSLLQAPFCHAEHSQQEIRSYADILLTQGWGNQAALWGLVEGWLCLFRLLKPDLIICDYSPSAVFAAKIAELPCLRVGNGFEIPPEKYPLPGFPHVSGRLMNGYEESEKVIVQNMNVINRLHKSQAMNGIYELFPLSASIFTTFPELDHYGEREGANYVGVMQQSYGKQKINWQDGINKRVRVFLYLRPSMPHIDAIVNGLKLIDAQVICFAAGFQQNQLNAWAGSKFHFVSALIDLNSIVKSTDLCISYGAEGTTALFLRSGVPQIISPQLLEGHLFGSRVEALGCGLVLRGGQTAESVALLIKKIIGDRHYKLKVMQFAAKYQSYSQESAVDKVLLKVREYV